MPLNTAGTCVTMSNKSSGTCKAEETIQLGFADKERPGSQNSSARVMTAFALICVELWDFFFKLVHLQQGMWSFTFLLEMGMCPVSHAQCETRTCTPVSCFPVPVLCLPQLKLRAVLCFRTLCTSHLLEGINLELEE